MGVSNPFQSPGSCPREWPYARIRAVTEFTKTYAVTPDAVHSIHARVHACPRSENGPLAVSRSCARYEG